MARPVFMTARPAFTAMSPKARLVFMAARPDFTAMSPKARLVFMGSPAFAVPSLRALCAHHTVAGVVTQPDRPAGRGQRLAESAVKAAARELGLPILQPEKLRAPEALIALREWNPDAIVVAAFGQILRKDVLD